MKAAQEYELGHIVTRGLVWLITIIRVHFFQQDKHYSTVSV